MVPMTASISRHFSIALQYIIQALKMRLEYRADFFIECVAALMQQAAGLLMLIFLFQNIQGLKEWRWEEVLFIHGFSLLPRAFFDAFAMGLYGFSDKYIVQGEMDRCLLRPLSTLFQVMLEGFSLDFIADLVLGICIITYASIKLGHSWDVYQALWVMAFIFGGWGVLTGVFVSLTSMAFWSSDRLAVVPPIYNLLEFARFPLNIFNKFVSFLLTFVVPFGFLGYYPCSALLGKGEQSWLAFAAPLAGVLSLLVAGMLWKRGLKKYSGAGS
jgi:ABC-2 type transport system permease protein